MIKYRFRVYSKVMKVSKVEDNERFFLAPALHMHTVARSSTSLRMKVVAMDAADANPDKDVEKELA